MGTIYHATLTAKLYRRLLVSRKRKISVVAISVVIINTNILSNSL